MGDPSDKSSELERGSSLRASARFSNVTADEDDYDLQAMGIADGFRPVENTYPHTERPSTTPVEPPTARIPPPRPSSVTKPHRRNESLTLRHDGSSDSESERAPSSVSTASTTSPFIDPEEPYDGPSGPSHPYQMYPQNVRLARTASLATTSTAPISERSYNGPRGPTHPYGMYPQNIIPEADGTPNPTAQRNINVGFPGATDNYQRRIGPDGEDVADLIGPDGHTEQLPPYTRYPEEAYHRKALGIEAPQAAPVQPMLAIPGAGGIGMATRNPEFASTEDLGGANSPQSRQSVRSFTSEASHQEMNAAARAESAQSDPEVTDEKKSLKEWQVTAKRRVWGIVPCWAIVLAGVVLVLMGIILGAVIGTLVNPHLKKGPPPDKPPSPAVSQSNWDTQPLATLPPDLPPLQEGTFAMPLMNNRISNTCFNDSTLAQAWNCNIVFSQLSMTIMKLAGQPNVSDYSFGFLYNDTFSIKNNVYSYGMQPPDLTDLKLKLVNDLYELSRGPAWNFEVKYNKTVILPEELLTPSPAALSTAGGQRRRMLFGGDFKRKGIAQVGDRPWICHWDNTVLETFIYAGQNNSFSRPIDPRPITSATATASSDSVSSAPAATPTEEDVDVLLGFEKGSDFIPSQGVHGDPQDHRTSTPVSDGAATTTTSSAPASSSSGWFDKDFPMPNNPIPIYPRVIKVEERRNAESTKAKPWCRQYQIVGEYKEAEPVRDIHGNIVEVYIDEEERDFEDPVESRRAAMEHYLWLRNSGKLGSDMTDCGCMWWLT
ncbi:hypothetical protein AAE478_007766 [Parahypoxylon ruwenzoriense]